MVEIRVNGSTKNTEVFNQVMAGLVESGVFACDITNKVYDNFDGTNRRYYNTDILKSEGLEAVGGFFSVGGRITCDSKEEFVKMLDVLSQIGAVYYKENKRRKQSGLELRKKHGKYSTMVAVMSKPEAAKKSMMDILNEDWVLYNMQ